MSTPDRFGVRRALRSRGALAFAFLCCAAVAQAQTISNPHAVSFLASTDHNTIASGGQPVVTRYDMELYQAGAAQPFLVLNLGKPASGADGYISVDFWSMLASPPMPGQVLAAKVCAVGPGGSGDSTPSNSFVFDGGPPVDTTAPTLAITTPTAAASYSTTSASLTIGGTASDNVGVTQVNWANDRGGSGTAGTATWSASVALQTGANVITVTARDAAGNTRAATLTVIRNGPAQGPTQPPIGLVDSPAQKATGVAGAIGVTGWVVDDVGVRSVKIYRNCLAFEPAADCAVVQGVSVVYLGDATLVAGARPDIEALYPSYPQANQAGWGYLMLTNMLPHVPNQQLYGGQGTLTLHVLAEDMAGNQRWLGRSFISYPTETDQVPTTITMANDTLARPFGAIDTPTQGQTVSGAFWNFGWALTPDGNTSAGAGDMLVPLDGSTQWVYIDGVAVGRVGTSNLCRGSVESPVPAGAFCDDDVASIFGNRTPQPAFTLRTANPTVYRNLDAGRGPIAAYWLDTTTLSNGVHAIVWGVTDSAGRSEGIGSRYFTVSNGTSAPAASSPATGLADTAPATSGALRVVTAMATGAARRAALAPPRPYGRGQDARGVQVARGEGAGIMDTLRPTGGTVRGRAGFAPSAPYADVVADQSGVRRVQIPDLGRLELRLETPVRGYLVAGGTLRDLPAGSHLNRETGVFTWTPGLGYRGTYRLVFVGDQEQVDIDVTVRPVASSEPDEHAVRMAIDLPGHDAVASAAVTVAGWALDPQAWTGTGIDEVQVWAQRVDVPTAAPQFLGAAGLGHARPDVAQAHGAMFLTAGFSLTTDALGAGTYDVRVYPHRAGTNTSETFQTVRVTVK